MSIEHEAKVSEAIRKSIDCHDPRMNELIERCPEYALRIHQLASAMVDIEQHQEATRLEFDAIAKRQAMRANHCEPVGPFFHGSCAELRVDDIILPPAQTGVHPEGVIPENQTRTFVTTSYEKAVYYAVGRALLLGKERGFVFEVAPQGSLTPDPTDLNVDPPDAYFCRSARVVRVITPTPGEVWSVMRSRFQETLIGGAFNPGGLGVVLKYAAAMARTAGL